MAKYKLLISASAEKRLKKVPKKDLLKIITAIQQLVHDPFPMGCRKLTGEKDVYRIRQGQYRVIYQVNKGRLIILVLKLGHRKDIYRG